MQRLTTPPFQGDAEFSVECTGSACKGDHVKFSRATFIGRYQRPEFTGYETVEGTIRKESYGSKFQQHTFVIATATGNTVVMGRTLYRHGCWRKPWPREADRQPVLAEKQLRGEQARRDRRERLDPHNQYGA